MSRYELYPPLKGLARKVKESFPNDFSHIDLERIVCVMKLSGAAPSKYYARVISIKPPYSLLTNAQYFLEISENPFLRLPEEAQCKVIEHEFLHIPRSFSGSLITHDLEDFRTMVRKYGVDYVEEGQED